MESLPINVAQLNVYILNSLNSDSLEDETLPILSDLRSINELGLTTFESQPCDPKSRTYNDGSFWVQRAYLNGMYPKDKISKFAGKLQQTNPNIVLGETILHTNPMKDTLRLYNFKNDGIPLLDGLSPMACCVENGNINWHDGYSGNVDHPMIREYIDDYFFEFSPELINEIVENYSMIQVWSQDINDNIFRDIIQSLKSMN